MSDFALFRVGKTWHYRFQIDGARVQKSTRESVKYKAEQVAQKAYDRVRLWARGDKHIPTLLELAGEWIEVHRPIVSRSHLRSVEFFKKLHTYELGAKLIDEITTDDVEAARTQHLKTHAPASANHWLNILKVLANWAVRRRIIPELPWQVKKLKLQKKPRVMLPPSSAVSWLKAVDATVGEGRGIATAARLMLGLGLRESECITARWEWLDWDRRSYTPGLTKGREADPLPLPAWLYDYLLQQRQAQGLIVTRQDGGAFASGFARPAMRAANAACGIGNLTPHRLRGTYATMLSEQGVPVQTVQRMMRHKDAQTTMDYLEVNLETATRAQKGMAERLGFAAPQE